MRILEVGCGSDPIESRSFSEGAFMVHSDVRSEFIRDASTPNPLVVSDGRRMTFPAASFDYVVAKDVFGDPTLGYTMAEIVGFEAHDREEFDQKTMEKYGNLGAVDMIAKGLEAMAITRESDTTKLMLSVEIARILKPAGRLVVIETRTPQVAGDFFGKFSLEVGQGKHKQRVIRATPTQNLFQVQSVNSFPKQRWYCSPEELAHPKLQVWLLKTCL